MDWVFIVFAVGTLVYTFTIVKEYMAEDRLLVDRLEYMQLEKEDLEEKIKVFNEERAQMAAEIERGKEKIAELQGKVDQRLGQIKAYEEEMAKRGKYRL